MSKELAIALLDTAFAASIAISESERLAA